VLNLLGSALMSFKFRWSLAWSGLGCRVHRFAEPEAIAVDTSAASDRHRSNGVLEAAKHSHAKTFKKAGLPTPYELAFVLITPSVPHCTIALAQCHVNGWPLTTHPSPCLSLLLLPALMHLLIHHMIRVPLTARNSTMALAGTQAWPSTSLESRSNVSWCGPATALSVSRSSPLFHTPAWSTPAPGGKFLTVPSTCGKSSTPPKKNSLLIPNFLASPTEPPYARQLYRQL
jgi:hypothetical protein